MSKLEIITVVDIFERAEARTAVCVTTNGVIKKDGTLVMGKGIAQDANDRSKGLLAEYWGKCVRRDGNIPHYGGKLDDVHLISFPTKWDWRHDSDIELIKKSAGLVKHIVDKLDIEKVYLAFPGVSNGHLNEYKVYPELCKILDNRFILFKKAINR